MKEKMRKELEKWKKLGLKPSTNKHQGNFVPKYYSLQYNNNRIIPFNIEAVEYHIRMLKDTKRYIEQIQKTIGDIFQSKEEKYAIQRLENAITLLENHRAELIYMNVFLEIERLKEATTKKEMEQINFGISMLYHNHFKEDGFVKPYYEKNRVEHWLSFVDDKPITQKDVDKAIEVALSEIEEDTIEHKWVSHPNFKKYIIEQGKQNRAYPYTLIEEIRMASDIEEMQSDLERWNKNKVE